jgi:hypothetical protein
VPFPPPALVTDSARTTLSRWRHGESPLTVARFHGNAPPARPPVYLPSCTGKRGEMTGCAETQNQRSEGPQPSDQHLRTGLLIRRFGVRIPGGPPPNALVRNPTHPESRICRIRGGVNLGRIESAGLPPECRATLLDGADPLLAVQPEVTVGDHAGGFLEGHLGLLIRCAALRAARRICDRRGSRAAVPVGSVSENPFPRPTNSMPPDFRASAASSRSGASVLASSQMRSSDWMGDRWPLERDTPPSV